MKKKMTLPEVRTMYRGQEVTETRQGFEVEDPKSGLTFVLPKKFYLGMDGKPLDPKRLLTLHRCYATYMAFGCDLQDDPLFVQVLCGRLEGGKFYPVDPMVSSNSLEIEAVLLRAHWDAYEGVVRRNWDEVVERCLSGCTLYSHYDQDYDGYVGDWYVVLKLDGTSPASVCHVGTTVVFYMQTMNDVIQVANQTMEEFMELRKGYRKIILDVLMPLRAQPDQWRIDDDDEDQTVVYQLRKQPGTYNVTELLLPEEIYRHNATGYSRCRERFADLYKTVD